MSGESYTAVVGLRYPDGPDEVRKFKQGLDCKWKSVEAGTKHLTDVPRENVKNLLAEGAIKLEEPKGGKQ